MVSSTNGVQSANAAAGLSFTATTPAASMDSFAQQLLTAIEGYLDKSGNTGQLEIDIQKQPQSQNSDSRQFIVTLKNPGTPPSTANVTPMSSSPAASLAPAAPSLAIDPKVVADKSKMSPDDAYWAMQPSAVQALRDLPDSARGAAAQALASQGYTIDVPIMVWGWDPLATMVQRQIDGYTWVPSGMQDSLPLGPGITFPGRQSYDPTSPPPGSIMVSTDFALGTNGQNPAMKYVNTVTT